MTKFEIILAIVNILAIIIIPIVAVFVGQHLQSKSEKRKDKMQIFQCLMTKRITGWAGLDAVNALNSIDIVFSDCEAVRKQWAILLSKFRRDVTAQAGYITIMSMIPKSKNGWVKLLVRKVKILAAMISGCA